MNTKRDSCRFLFLSLILACGFSLPASASYTMTISPSSASVPVGDAQQFIATSDPAGPISWSLEIVYWTGCPRPYCVRHVTSCSGCGTLSPTSTQSGAPTTYTAPSIPVSFPEWRPGARTCRRRQPGIPIRDGCDNHSVNPGFGVFKSGSGSVEHDSAGDSNGRERWDQPGRNLECAAKRSF